MLTTAQQALADITYSDGGIYNISTSMPVGTINVTNGTTLNVLSGASLTSSSYFIITANYNSPVNIYGGNMAGPFGLYILDSPLNIYGGTITSDQGISVSGGGTTNIYGGTIMGDFGISAGGSSPVNIYGGTIATTGQYAVQAINSEQINIYGGNISSNGGSGIAIEADGTGSIVNVYGGKINGSIQLLSGAVDIFGSGFNYGYGQVGATSGTLIGTLADGTPIDVTFSNNEGEIILSPTSTPLPAAAYLFASGLIGIVVLRRKYLL